jgi:transcriptional regulator with XRE-family HTH domain
MLGQRVTERRKALGLSISSAARAAKIHRNTWSAIERGERETEEYIFGSVERALLWETGSADKILNGGEPTSVESQHAPNEPPLTYESAEEELLAIANNPNRSGHLRTLARIHLDQLQAIRAAERAEAEARGERAS